VALEAEEPVVLFAYGHADQSVFRAFGDALDAMLVPGTIATYFREATGGFVLSLGVPYVIDPRTPIFQYGIPASEIRASHNSLADACGPAFSTALRAARAFDELSEDQWIEASRNIVAFQRTYAETSSSRMAKYAALLGRPAPVAPGAPTLVLPAYLMAEQADHIANWQLSLQMLEAAQEGAGDIPVAAVVALRSYDASHPSLPDLDQMLGDVEAAGIDTVFFWLNDFHERSASADLVAGMAHLLGRHADLTMYTLYGGYLSLALNAFGLRGVGSGVGYSESRDATQLFRTGAPRPRYYHPKLHGFLNADVAELLVRQAGTALQCSCVVCQAPEIGGISIGRLDLRSLMLHFVHVRKAEQVAVRAMSVGELAEDLEESAATLEEAARRLAGRLGSAVSVDRLRRWADGLRAAA
jgi:hypothetical protein